MTTAMQLCGEAAPNPQRYRTVVTATAKRNPDFVAAKRKLDFAPETTRRAPASTFVGRHNAVRATPSAYYFFFLYTPSYYVGFHETANAGRPRLPACQEQLLPKQHDCMTMSRWLATTAAEYRAAGLHDLEALPEGRLRDEARAVKYYTYDTAFSFVQACLAQPDRINVSKLAPNNRAFVETFVGSFASDSPLRKLLPYEEPWTLFTGETSKLSLVLWEAIGRSRDSPNNARIAVPVQLSTSWHMNVGLHFHLNYALDGAGGLVVLHYAPGQGHIYGHYVDEIGTKKYNASMGECEIILQPGLQVQFLFEETLEDMVAIPLNALSDTVSKPRRVTVRHVAIFGADAKE